MRDQEVIETFTCFGSTCSLVVAGDGAAGSASEAVTAARHALLEWHERFSRFLAHSELSMINSDRRETVEVTPMMARLAQAAITAASLTSGLVDATLLAQIETAGYTHDLREPVPLQMALALAPPRAPAHAARQQSWRRLAVSTATNTLTRPPGVRLDSGGIAKGLFADVLAERLATHASFAVSCAGDLTIGGAHAPLRAIHVESPFNGSVLHTFHASHTGVATSGIGRRSWLDGHGRPAHHLLDPSTGRPAFTGIVQVTALAPSALIAETLAKAALLSGPRGAAGWLRHGGAIVFDDGSHKVFEPPPTVTLQALSPFVASHAAA
jgi:thiamine biosynthesis lipoprotein